MYKYIFTYMNDVEDLGHPQQADIEIAHLIMVSKHIYIYKCICRCVCICIINIYMYEGPRRPEPFAASKY